METGKFVDRLLQSFGTSLILVFIVPGSAESAEPSFPGNSSLSAVHSDQLCFADSVSQLVLKQELACELTLLPPQELSTLATEQQLRFEGLQQESEKLQGIAEANQIKFQRRQAVAENRQEEYEQQQFIAQSEQLYWEGRQYQAIARGALAESQLYYQKAQQALRKSKSLLQKAEKEKLRAEDYRSHAEAYQQKTQQYRIDSRRFQKEAKIFLDRGWYLDGLRAQSSEENGTQVMKAIDKKEYYEGLTHKILLSIHLLSLRLIQADIALISARIAEQPTDINTKVVSLIVAEKKVRHHDIDLLRQKVAYWSEMAIIEQEEADRKNFFLFLGLIVVPIVFFSLFSLVIVARLGQQLTSFTSYSHLDPIGRCLYDSMPEECRSELMVLCQRLKATESDSWRLKYLTMKALLPSLFVPVKIYVDDQWNRLMIVLRMQ